ncbi:MAG TPA: DUF3618 domain-containing protein [Candidatus Limnocylindria bacterium]|nr:DUF3618 domain-containing protein [Candidatus Limnocylindria bacterium]
MTLERDDVQGVGTMTDDEAEEALEIRTEIEETRIEMGGTLSELGDRLEPGRLMSQAKDNVRDATIGRVEETAKGMSDMVMETIKRNPIPAALAGAGLALLWMNRSDGSDHHYRTVYERNRGADDGLRDRIGSTASSVGDSVSGAVGQVGDTAGRIGHNVGQTAEQVGQNVGQTAGDIGAQLDRFMQASPMAMGAIALGAGAVVGALVPTTPQERELLSDARREIGSTVHDAVDQAATKAEEVLDRTEEKVTSGA